MKKRDVLQEPRLSDRTKWLITGLAVLLVLAAAVIILLVCLNRNSQRADVLITEGNGFYALSEYDQAELCYKEAISLRDGAASAYLGLGKTYLAKGSLEDAISVLESGYKKTEDASILAELDQLKTEPETLAGNRSVLTVKTPAETTAPPEQEETAAAVVQGTPGRQRENEPTIPEVDANTIAAMRGEQAEDASGGAENAAGESQGADSLEAAAQTVPVRAAAPEMTTGKTTAAIFPAVTSATETTAVSYVVLTDDSGSTQTVSPEQWKAWYEQWQSEYLATTVSTTQTTAVTSSDRKSTSTAASTTRAISEFPWVGSRFPEESVSIITTTTLAEWEQWYLWCQTQETTETTLDFVSKETSVTWQTTVTAADTVSWTKTDSGTASTETTAKTEDTETAKTAESKSRLRVFLEWLLEKWMQTETESETE